MRLRLCAMASLVCVLFTASLWAGQDEELIEKTIRAAVTGAASFSETRDRRSLLQLYANEYEGIQDGQGETRDAIEKWFAEYEAELRQGSTLRFIGSVSNLRLRVDGGQAWGTYDYVFQAVRHGQLEGQDAGKCTSLLRKEASAWLIVHEHCSKVRTP